MSKRILAVGLAQMNPTVGDFKANAAKICDYIERAEAEKLDLIVFPELAVSGYPVWDLANKKSFVERGLRALGEIAASTRGKNAAAAVGYIDRANGAGRKSHNALAIIRNGKIIRKQYKTLLPTYDVFLEEIFFAPAKNQRTFALKGIPAGATICEDIWDDLYRVKPAKVLTSKGAKFLINISASPYHREVTKTRIPLIQRKAKEYGVWIIYVNQVGGQDDLIFDGRSFICDPKGKIRFQAAPFREGLFAAEIDFRTGAVIASERSERSSPQNSRAGLNLPYGLEKKGRERGSREMYQALLLGLSDYVRKNGFRKVVIGLSGGIDSALVAVLAADALGTESVIGVGMPGPYSSTHSSRDAKALAKNLGIEFRTKSIRSHYAEFVQAVERDKKNRGVKPVERASITLAMENLQARLRGLELMYLSNDEGALLLTTGNKSELAMGYTTLYGDMCGGLSVIGDVYKTDVYRLARYRNSVSKVIPESIFTKAPSAELRPHQKDQDSLPPYAVLDQILSLYIEENKSHDEIVKRISSKRISPKLVQRVLSCVDRNEYKRRQLPPALRITPKAWFGRRMPITNKFLNHG